MPNKKSLIVSLALLLVVFTFSATPAIAKKNEYELIVKHLKTKYQAKKVKVPFMWLARFAVSVVRPAGVKSFSVTLFEDLKFSRETLDEEMQNAMRDSMGEEWNSLMRVRSRNGQQVYMYMRESGKNVRIILVTIEKNNSTVVRATFNPEKLADFINDPKIFGISLNDNKNERSKTMSDEEEMRQVIKGLGSEETESKPDQMDEPKKEPSTEGVKKDN